MALLLHRRGPSQELTHYDTDYVLSLAFISSLPVLCDHTFGQLLLLLPSIVGTATSLLYLTKTSALSCFCWCSCMDISEPQIDSLFLYMDRDAEIYVIASFVKNIVNFYIILN